MSECAVSAHSSDSASAEREARRLSKAIQVESLPSDPRISIKISNEGCSDTLGEGDNATPGRQNKSTAAFVTLVIAAALLFGLIFTLFSFNFDFFEVRCNYSCFWRMPLLGFCSSPTALCPKPTTRTWLSHQLAESARPRISSPRLCGSKSHHSATKSRSSLP
jgi:hypothetical protein